MPAGCNVWSETWSRRNARLAQSIAARRHKAPGSFSFPKPIPGALIGGNSRTATLEARG